MNAILRQNNGYVDEHSSSALLISQISLNPLLKLPEGPADNKAFDLRPRFILTQTLTTFGKDNGEPKLG